MKALQNFIRRGRQQERTLSCKFKKRTIKIISIKEANDAIRHYTHPKNNKKNRSRPKLEAKEEDKLTGQLLGMFEKEAKDGCLLFKHVQKSTKQPPAYLRRIMRKIADEVNKGEYKLKEEFEI